MDLVSILKLYQWVLSGTDFRPFNFTSSPWFYHSCPVPPLSPPNSLPSFFLVRQIVSVIFLSNKSRSEDEKEDFKFLYDSLQFIKPLSVEPKMI